MRILIQRYFYPENSTLSNTTGSDEPAKFWYITYRYWYPMRIPNYDYDKGQDYNNQNEVLNQNQYPVGTLSGSQSASHNAGVETDQFLLLLIPFILLCGVLILLIAMLILRARLSKMLKRQIEAQNSRRHLASMYRASAITRHLGIGNPSNCYAEAPGTNVSRPQSTRGSRNTPEAIARDMVLPTIHERVTPTPSPPEVDYTEIYVNRPLTTTSSNSQK